MRNWLRWLTESEVRTEVINDAWGRCGQYTRELAAFLWIAGLIAMIYLFGFVAAIVAFCLIYGLVYTRRVILSWKHYLLFGAVSALLLGISVLVLFHAVNVIAPSGIF